MVEGEVIKQLVEYAGKVVAGGAGAEVGRRAMEKILTSLKRKLKSKNEKVENLKLENINHRTLNRVMQDGLFSDDELCIEYFSGILASAISEDGKDDSAMPYLNIVNSLSAKQLRLHFLIYQAINKKLVADDTKRQLNVGLETELSRENAFFSVLEIANKCGYKDINIQSELDVLLAQNLLKSYTMHIHKVINGLPLYYLQFTPSSLGIQLYAVNFNKHDEWRTYNYVCFSDEKKHYDSIVTPLELVGGSLEYFDENANKCLELYLVQFPPKQKQSEQ